MVDLAAQFDANAGVLDRTLGGRAGLAPKLSYWAASVAGLPLAGAALLTPATQPAAVAIALFSLVMAFDSAVRSGIPLFERGDVNSALQANAGATVNPREAEELLAGVDVLADGLERVSQAVPILLVVDDAENPNRQLTDLVRRIVGGSGNITVVVATDLTVTESRWRAWLTQAGSGGILPLRTLPPADLAALAVELAPQLPEPSQAGLATILEVAAGQPGLLCDLLRAPAIRSALGAGAPLPADLQGWSSTHRADERHDGWPRPTQEALERLAAVGPATTTFWAHHTGVALTTLEAAAEPLPIRVTGESITFTSRRAYQAALRGYHQHHTPEQTTVRREAYLQLLKQARLSGRWGGLSQEVRHSALRFLIDHHTEPDPAWLIELADLRRRNGDITNTQDDLLQAILTRTTTPGAGTARLVRVAADTLLALGHHDQGIALYQAELDAVTARRGPHDPARIPTLEALAYLNAAYGHDLLGRAEAHPYLIQAVALFHEVLDLRDARLRTAPPAGDPGWNTLHLKTANTRWSLAEALVDLREFRGSTGALQTAHTVISELIGLGWADRPSTLAQRASLAAWTGDAGDPAGARDLFAALLPDYLRVLGADHPNTLTTRNNLATWTGDAGDPAGARDLFAALLLDRVRVLGADHPDTLTTRNNLDACTGDAGDPAGARDLFAALLPIRQTRVRRPS